MGAQARRHCLGLGRSRRRSNQRMPSFGSSSVHSCSSALAISSPSAIEPLRTAQARAPRKLSCSANRDVEPLPAGTSACRRSGSPPPRPRGSARRAADAHRRRRELRRAARRAYSRIVSSIPRRPLSQRRTRLLTTSDSRSSRSASQTASAASSEKLPLKTASLRKSSCSSGSSRS